MQEEVENRTVNLAISTTKLTGRTTRMCGAAAARLPPLTAPDLFPM